MYYPETARLPLDGLDRRRLIRPYPDRGAPRW